MKNLILILLFASFASRMSAQSICPNVFKCGNNIIDVRDGNKYPTVKIGIQCWMAKNLNAVKYVNGDYIPNVTDNTAWVNLISGAYCDYGNTPANSVTYGRLYNRYAVMDNRNLCPIGWYIPTIDEWTTLANYLGGVNVAGGALKVTGSTYWYAPNTGATNSTGFSALGAGNRNYSYCDMYYGQRLDTFYWSTSVDASSNAWSFVLNYDLSTVILRSIYYFCPTESKAVGFSVRCIKGN